MHATAPWASEARRSRGRRIAEPGLDREQGFRIDRERIVHCTAFRRLVYKTQVFINHEGDLFRVLAGLRGRLPPHLVVNDCSIERNPATTAARGPAARLRATCNADLITIREKGSAP